MSTPYDDEPIVNEQPTRTFCPYCGQPLPKGYDEELHPPDGW
jgi:hypothetical protein